MSLKTDLKTQQIEAMRAKDKVRLGTIRMLLAAVKQIEIDERIELSDAQITDVIIKSVKQRKDSISQFEKANRKDLIDIEKNELTILEAFLPKPFSPEDVDKHILNALESTGAASMKDMAKVMAILGAALKGRADMAEVSTLVKAKLG